MKLEEFLKNLNIAFESPNIYNRGGWGKWNGKKFEFDCVCMIKAILWGFIGIKEGHGGAVYASNGVPDISTEQMINVCSDVSSDFANIKIGQMVWMPGHVGMCTKPIDESGYGEITEATVAFGWSGIIKTRIDKYGNRTFEGSNETSNPWQKFGYLPYIDYEEEIEPTPEPTNDIKVGDWVVPIELVNYYGTPLTQYDDVYKVTEIDGDRAVCCAEREGEWQIWASMNVNNLRKVDID